MIRIDSAEQARHVGGALAAARGLHPAGVASRLAMPALTVDGRRSVLLVAARHSTADDMRTVLLGLCTAGHASRYNGEPATAASLFTQLRIAVQRLEKVNAGEIDPGDVIGGREFTDAQLADGTAKAFAVDRCELDVLEVLELLAPGLARAPETGDPVATDEILPGW